LQPPHFDPPFPATSERFVKPFAGLLAPIRALDGAGVRITQITDIRELRGAPEPIGADNDAQLEQILRDADLHLVAWGQLAKLPEILRKRWIDVVRIADRVGYRLQCIGVNDDGHPRHPLMTGYEVPIAAWPAPWFPNRQRKNLEQ
jgi:hypothetical protein